MVGLADRNPVTGIGPDVVAARLANGQPPHNDVLRALVEMGILGLAAYTAVLVALVGVAVERVAPGPRASIDDRRTAFVGVVSSFVVTSLAANLLGQVVLLWYVLALPPRRRGSAVTARCRSGTPPAGAETGDGARSPA